MGVRVLGKHCKRWKTKVCAKRDWKLGAKERILKVDWRLNKSGIEYARKGARENSLVEGEWIVTMIELNTLPSYEYIAVS